LAGVSPARRLLRDRAAVAFGLLFLLLALAFFAAPLYASAVAHTTFSESRLSEQIVLDGEATYIVSLVGVPIGPTCEGSYFLGADEIGRGNLRDAFIAALPVTLSLVIGAALIAIVAGVGLAMVCVRHLGRWQDRLITTAATAAYSVPSLVLAALLWGFLTYRWNVFPQGGYVPLTEDPVQWAWHLVLPWIAAAVPFAGAYIQFVRASLLQAVDQEWVRTARAKGLSEKRVIRRHVLRNGLIPPVNLWGLDFSHAFGGFALYVELIFDLPGIGLLTAQTMGGLDLPPIVAMTIYLTIVVVLVSALVDLVIAALDPRIRRSGTLV
jgi:peptide/nickel transport system permease protein